MSGPAGSTGTRELAVKLLAGAAVGTRTGDAWLVHNLAVGAGKALRAVALILVGVGVFAGPSVETRLMRPTIVEICNVIVQE